MNRHYIEIQGAIADLGDHLGRVQLLVHNLTGVPRDPQARQP